MVRTNFPLFVFLLDTPDVPCYTCNMNNLYMDDVRICPYVGYTTVRTVEEAMVLLATGEVNHCSLDHDMGSCADCHAKGLDVGDMKTASTTFMHWCPHNLDGTKLARWIVETGNWPRHKPEVHSANPVGRERMRGIFDRYWPERTLFWPHLPERKVVLL